MLDIDTAEALWVLGILCRRDLPNVASSALERGLDNEPLRILAGLVVEELDEAPSLFKRALEQLGRPKLDKKSAARAYAQSISKRIMQKTLDPYVGAKGIWKAAIAVQTSEPDFHELDPFIYAASEYEDRPEDRSFFSEQICKEAQRWA